MKKFYNSTLKNTLTNYIENQKQLKNENTCTSVIGYIISKIKDKTKVTLDPRTIYKWKNGEAFPDINNLIALSEILNVTVDELLKTQITEFNEDKLPSWYKKLNNNEINALLFLTEPVRTGKISEALESINRGWFFKIMLNDTSSSSVKNSNYKLLIDASFKCLLKNNEWFFDDKLLSNEDIFINEKNKLDPILKRQLLNDYFTLNTHHDIDEILKVVDVGYFDNSQHNTLSPHLYKHKNFTGLYDDENNAIYITEDEKVTENANEIGYSIDFARSDVDSFVKHNSTKNKKHLESLIKTSIYIAFEKHFKTLSDNNIIKLVASGFSDFNFDSYTEFEIDDSYYENKTLYYTLFFEINIDEEDLTNILTDIIKKQSNYAKTHKNICDKIYNYEKDLVDLANELNYNIKKGEN